MKISTNVKFQTGLNIYEYTTNKIHNFLFFYIHQTRNALQLIGLPSVILINKYNIILNILIISYICLKEAL